MGVLGGGGRAGLPAAGGLVHIGFAPAPADELLGRGHRLVRDAQRVGTHIGDEAHGAVVLDVHPFIQRLGGPHRAGGRKAEGPAGVLLQGGGDEGRGRRTPALALVHLGHRVGLALQRGEDRVGFGFGLDRRLGAVRPGGQPGCEGAALLRFQVGVQVPVFLRLELFDLQLPVPDQPHRHALHPAGRKPPAHLAPQKRAELVAHQPVQLPPGLLGVEQVHVDGAGVGHALLHPFFGDLVEGDPVGGRRVQTQQVGQVPADGLAFPVRVGGQQHAVALFGLGLQLLDQLLLALDGDILGLVPVFNVNAQLAGRQIPHMAHAGGHLVPAAQVLANGLGLGRGFHND